VVAVLCGLSFYLGNIFDSEKTKLSSEVINKEADDEVTSSLSRSDCLQPALKVEPFPECSINLQDNTPCSDPKVKNNTYVKFNHGADGERSMLGINGVMCVMMPMEKTSIMSVMIQVENLTLLFF
jgi:hypothetical protein